MSDSPESKPQIFLVTPTPQQLADKQLRHSLRGNGIILSKWHRRQIIKSFKKRRQIIVADANCTTCDTLTRHHTVDVGNRQLRLQCVKCGTNRPRVPIKHVAVPEYTRTYMIKREYDVATGEWVSSQINFDRTTDPMKRLRKARNIKGRKAAKEFRHYMRTLEVNS